MRISDWSSDVCSSDLFFYGPDLRGFNFQRDKGPLARLAGHLIEIADQADPVAIYAGAAALDAHLPGFAAEHRFPLLGDDAEVTARIWLGNATRVATHFDLSDNFAAVALGRRCFTDRQSTRLNSSHSCASRM